MTPLSKPITEERHLVIDGRRVPRFFYGTAWKEDDTRRLATQALGFGFRAIDTANQRKHYFEAAAGEAIQNAISGGMVTRDALFVQTKFTHRRGQDNRLPYDPNAPVAGQVHQSFKSSLEHLRLEKVDSYVLHGPTVRDGLAAQDWAAWRAMEDIHQTGGCSFLGISNVTLQQVEVLCSKTRTPPRFVQNRCYASRGWDKDMRRFCTANNIVYQGFSLLTANRGALQHPKVLAVAKRHGVPATSIIFRFALDVGMIALTGTTSAEHMRTDLAVLKFRLDEDEVKTIEGLDFADPKKVFIAVKKP